MTVSLTAPQRTAIVSLHNERMGSAEISAHLQVPITLVQAVVATLPPMRPLPSSVTSTVPSPSMMPIKAAPRDARLESLLAEGDRSPRQATRTLAERVRVGESQLRDRLAQEARQLELTARVAQLTTQLRQAQDELRAAKTTPAPNPRST